MGFVGSALLSTNVLGAYEIVKIDRKRGSHEDIMNIGEINRIADATVVHIAWNVINTDPSFFSIERQIESIQTTLRLLDMCQKAHAFIYASSHGVTGPSLTKQARDSNFVFQDGPGLPKGSSFANYYAAKVMMEELVAKWALDTGIPTSVVRVNYVPAPDKRTVEQTNDVGRLFGAALQNSARFAVIE